MKNFGGYPDGFRFSKWLMRFLHSAVLIGSIGSAFAQEPAAPEEPSTSADEARDPQIVGLVDGRKILRADIDRRVVGRYGRELAKLSNEQQIEVRLRAEQTSLEELIDRALLANVASAGPQYQPSESQVDQRMDQFQEQLPAGSDLNMALDELGLTEKKLRAEVSLELAINQVIDETMDTVGAPTAEEVRKFYDDQPEYFTKRDKASARHILISTEGISDETELAAKKASAEKLRVRLMGDNPEDFATLAAAHSDCKSKVQGGMLGSFGRGDMVEGFENAAFSQEVGSVGPVLKTEFGYHIIRVEERQTEGVAPFEEVANTLPDFIKRQRRLQAVEDFVKELREKAKIQRFL
jgi:peptidyl-prolyl cis-trans isomerase C